MVLSPRQKAFNAIIDQMESCEKNERWSQLLEHCWNLSVNYKDLLDLDKELFLKGILGRACAKVGRYGEAKRVLGELLTYNKDHGLPIASSTHMYRWLCAYYEGDEQKALQEHIKLDDAKAINLLKQASMCVQSKPKEADEMEKLIFKPIMCLRCGSKFREGEGEPIINIVGDEIHTYPGGLAGGDIACPKCHEKHDFRIYENKLTLHLRSAPSNYVGVREKTFNPVSKNNMQHNYNIGKEVWEPNKSSRQASTAGGQTEKSTARKKFWQFWKE
jgi:hypothetical protein